MNPTQKEIQFARVSQAILDEMRNQDIKFGVDKEQSLPGYMLLIRKELEEAENGWTKSLNDKHACLNELVQVAALTMRALMTYGTTGCAISTNDKSVTQTVSNRTQYYNLLDELDS
jgi:hypothetical protein